MPDPLMSESDLQTLDWYLANPRRRMPADVRSRAITWLDRMLEVRELQRTKNHGPFHRDMMEAFSAATDRWIRDRELASNSYAAEGADYEQDHPRPTLKEFMMHYRHDPTVTCPVCGTEFKVEK